LLCSSDSQGQEILAYIINLMIVEIIKDKKIKIEIIFLFLAVKWASLHFIRDNTFRLCQTVQHTRVDLYCLFTDLIII
jgi:hypothetical protein